MLQRIPPLQSKITDTMMEMLPDVLRIHPSTRPIFEQMTPQEVEELKSTCRRRIAGIRGRAIFIDPALRSSDCDALTQGIMTAIQSNNRFSELLWREAEVYSGVSEIIRGRAAEAFFRQQNK
jgi:hypothetical protein